MQHISQLHYSLLMHCSAGTAIHSPHLIPISPEPAPWSWHVHPHETSLRQENVNCPLGIKMQTHTAIWKCCGKRSTGLCPMPLFKIFSTELFITSLYLGIQIISSLCIALLTNSSNSEGSAPKGIHMETFNEIQGLCCKQLANIQNCRQDCKQYSSEHHRLSMEQCLL